MITMRSVKFKNPVPLLVDTKVSTTFFADGRVRVDVVAADGQVIESAEAGPEAANLPEGE